MHAGYMVEYHGHRFLSACAYFKISKKLHAKININTKWIGKKLSINCKFGCTWSHSRVGSLQMASKMKTGASA